jgi:hypothetical protein
MIQGPSFDRFPGFSGGSPEGPHVKGLECGEKVAGGGEAKRKVLLRTHSRAAKDLADGESLQRLVPLPGVLHRLENRPTDVQSERVKRLVRFRVEHADVSRDFVRCERRGRGAPVGV